MEPGSLAAICIVEPEALCIVVEPGALCIVVEPEALCIAVEPEALCIAVEPGALCIVELEAFLDTAGNNSVGAGFGAFELEAFLDTATMRIEIASEVGIDPA